MPGIARLRDKRGMRFASIVVLAMLVACGDDGRDEDALGCFEVDGEASFARASDFGAAEAGSLRGWAPDGRWFVTGAALGYSSILIERSGDGVVLDRTRQASIDDTAIFALAQGVGSDGAPATKSQRISNLAADGSARLETATCDGGTCRRCAAKLIRATRLEGEGEGSGLSLLGELRDPAWGAGPTFNVRVAGTLAYLIRLDGLHIIETADPAHPVELGHYQRVGKSYSNDVKIVDANGRRYALIADAPVDVVDVTDPAAPVLVSTLAEDAHTLFVETVAGDTRVYTGGNDGTCAVYNVSDPTQPRKMGSYQSGARIVHDLSVVGGIAYLNAWNRGFVEVSFSDPAKPTELGFWGPTPGRTSHSNWTTASGDGRRIALHGEEGYDAHLHVIDLDLVSSTRMQPIAEWQTRPWVSIHNIMAFGTRAYLTHYQDGVRVLDLSTATAPRQIGYFNTWDPASELATNAFYEGAVGLDVDQARKLVFVADTPRGLLILRDEL